MADISDIISAMKLLVSCDPDPSAPAGDWRERLTHNEIKVRNISSVNTAEIKSEYELNVIEDDQLWGFVTEGVALLMHLHKFTCSASPDGRHNLLSMSDQSIIRKLSQFISILGLYRYLHVDIPPSCQSTSLGKIDKSTDAFKDSYLLKCLRPVLHVVIYNDALSPILLPNLLSNVLMSLLQLTYEPSSVISEGEREWCGDQLEQLLDRLSQPLVVRELLVFHGLSVRQKGGAKWLTTACGQLLSRQLMKKNGVKYVLRGIFEGNQNKSNDWRKYLSIARVIANCPLQAASINDYYSLVGPQILSMINEKKHGDDTNGGQYLRVSICTLNVMLEKNKEMAMKYLINPLMQPLRQLTGEVDCPDMTGLPDSFKECLFNIKTILSVMESTCLFVSIVYPYLPVLFEVWRTVEDTQLKTECKDVIVNVILSSDVTSQFNLFDHLLHIRTSLKCLNIKLQLTSSGEDFIVMQRLISNSSPSQNMEEIGDSIVKLLLDKQLVSIVNNTFENILKHLTLLLEKESDLNHTEGEGEGGTHDNRTNSAVLLKWEDEISKPHTNDFSHALTLYVLASLCENMTIDSLHSLNLAPASLTCLTRIVTCHAHCCMEDDRVRYSGKEKTHLKKLTGGHVSLRIAFGLLSAQLTSDKEIKGAISRRIFTEMLPHLELIRLHYPDEELALLAENLKICISTLGAVWSMDMKDPSFSEVKKNNHQKSKPLIEDITPPQISSFQNALKDLNSPLLPVQSHAIKQLTDLIRQKDIETLNQTKELLDIFSTNLHHTDTYIYLPAINGLTTLASHNPQTVIPLLCKEYAHFTEEEDKQRGTSDESTAGGKHIERALQWRLKIGEALVAIAKDCHDLLPHYSESFISSILYNVHHFDPLIRASSLSNLAAVCRLLKWSFARNEHEVICCIQDVSRCDPDATVRSAAINVIKELLEGLGTHADKILKGESLLQLYRTLKSAGSSDPDQLVRAHAYTALSELDSIMKQLLFPAQSLTKKISILDHMI